MVLPFDLSVKSTDFDQRLNNESCKKASEYAEIMKPRIDLLRQIARENILES